MRFLGNTPVIWNQTNAYRSFKREYPNNHLVIITDPKFWVYNETELKNWLDECCEDWEMEGMVLSFKSAEEKLSFLLRWQS